MSGSSAPEWYLPGVTPNQYEEGQKVSLLVNKLTSVKTQLPYRYYTLPFCEPEGGPQRIHGNIGSSLLGDSIETSPYQIEFLKNNQCRTLCTKKLTGEDVTAFKRMIDDDYQVNWILDNLPGTTKYTRKSATATPGGAPDYTYMVGFPVGLEQGKRYFMHNHARIIIQ